MVSWDEKRKQLTDTGKDYKSLLPTVDKKAGISSWDQRRIELGAMPDTRPSTQIRNQFNTMLPPSASGFGGLENTTLGQAAAGNPSAINTYRKSTGTTIKPAPQPQYSPSNNSFLENIGAFNDRLNNAATLGLNDLADKYIFGKLPANDAYRDFRNEQQRIRNNFQAGPVAIVPEILGSVLPGELAYRGASALVKPITSNLSSNIAKNAVRGAATGALFQTGVEGVEIAQNDNQQSLGGRLGDIALSTALGGVGDAAVSGIGRYIGNRLGRNAQGPIQTQTVTQPVREIRDYDEYLRSGGELSIPLSQVLRENPGMAIPTVYKKFKDLNRAAFMEKNGLMLPEARSTARMSAAQARMSDTSIPPVLPGGLDLPAGAGPGATRARLGTAPNPYRQQYESLVAEAQASPNVKSAADLEQLWASKTNGEGPNLNELIDLAYPNRSNRVTSDLVERARNNQAQREVYGVPLPVRSASERINPAQIINNADAPLTKVGAAAKQAEKQASKRTKRAPTPVRADNYEMLDDALTDIPAPNNRPSAANIPTAPTAEIPNNVPSAAAPRVPGERGFVSTLADSPKTSSEFVDQLRARDGASYEPITNEATVAQANGRLGNIEEAHNYVMGGGKFTAEKAATAQRLIDHYNSRGQTSIAVDVAERLAEEATNAGQFIQSLSLYNRLTPDGLIKFVQKRVANINEKLPVSKRNLEVTAETKAQLMEIATISQRMTGIKTLSNDVVDIVTRAKNGATLSEADTAALQAFVKETQSFVKDATRTPRTTEAPQINTNPTKRQQVASFLDTQEQAAKERINQRRNRLSSTPLDVWADYAVIGASKMGKGVIKFSEWSEEMVRELGEEIRPLLPSLYDRSKDAFKASKNQLTKIESDQAVKLVNKIIKDKRLGEEDASSLSEVARRVAVLSGEEKRMASQDLQKILQAFDKPTIGRKLASAQTTAQLLNPRTQVRNIVGNELFYRTERLTKILASPIDAAVSKLTGKNRHITFRTYNQGEYWKNWMLGLKAGWEGTNINGLQSQFDLQAQAFTSKYNPLTYLEKALGASLRSFDNAGYMRAYNKSLGEMGTLDALNKGIKGDAAIREHVKNYIAFADDSIMNLADNYGKYVTFQDNNKLSMALSKTKRALNANRSFGFGDFVLKYPKTPGAILMRALEYSPAGFVRSAMLANRAIRHLESEKAPEAAMAVARAALGTAGFAGMGYALMDNGVLTTAADKDLDVKRFQMLAGQSQYQINFSALQRYVASGFKKQDPFPQQGDFLYTYDWAQPIALSLSLGGEARKNQNKGKEADKLGVGLDFATTAVNSFAGAINTLTEQSVVQGIREAVGSSYPGQTFVDKVFSILSSVPSSFVPTALNQARQYTDPVARETYGPTYVNKAYNQTINKIPGLNDRLPLSYDTLGNERQVMQTPSAFNIFLNPGALSEYKLSPNAQLVMNLINGFDDPSLAPRVPDKKILGNQLTTEQFSRLSQLQGGLTNEGISKINPDYTDEQKAEEIDDILRDASSEARDQLFKEYNLGDKRVKKR